jgi:hypothetical protein
MTFRSAGHAQSLNRTGSYQIHMRCVGPQERMLRLRHRGDEEGSKWLQVARTPNLSTGIMLIEVKTNYNPTTRSSSGAGFIVSG